MKGLHIQHNLIRLMRFEIVVSRYRVKNCDGSSDALNIRVGLLQGDSLASLLLLYRL